MGLILTKYETSTDIVFDTSKFDYRYDDVPFPEDTQGNFDDIIGEVGGNFDVITSVDTTDGTETFKNVRNITNAQRITIKGGCKATA